MNNIIEIKAVVFTVFSLLASLFAPILDFMLAMLLLLTANLIFGIASAKANGEEWSWKKALMFFAFCFGLFGTFVLIFLVGHFLHNETEAVFCVKYACLIAVWVFGTNIFRNWRSMLHKGTATYKFVDIMYYILTVQFVEKLPWIKKYQEEKENNHRTILDKDDN